jgi:GntR family transcriptional repressor for pyruvate dehydrogenase complex
VLPIKNEYAERILSEIKYADCPMGAGFLSGKMQIPQASIGRILNSLEKRGFLKKISNKGRQITPAGLSWLEEQHAQKAKLHSSQKLISIVEDLSKERLLEILDIRKLLEATSVELACINAGDEDIKLLEDILIDHRYAVRHDESGSAEDLRLHLTIAKLSRNETLYQIIELILTGKNAYDTFSAVADHVAHTQIQQHTDLIAAIKTRDPVQARQAMIRHLDQVISDVNKYFNN